MKYDSIAMIETNGLVSSIAALNAMLRLENIIYIRSKVITNGQVTVFISGKIEHLKHVILAGKVAANEVGNVISSAIIENPSDEILNLIIDKKEEKNKTRSKPKKVVATDNPLTLFDDVYENPIVSESQKKNEGLNYILEEELLEETEKEKVDMSDIKNKESLNFEPENNLEVEEKIEPVEEIVIEVKDDEPEELKENFTGLSHLDRLRAEAKLEIETENQNISSPKESIEINKKVTNSPKPSTYENKKVKNQKKIIIEDNGFEEVKPDIATMNVPQLRKLARGNPNFPIKGREISKANRVELLSYFNQLEN